MHALYISLVQPQGIDIAAQLLNIQLGTSHETLEGERERQS